MPIQSALRDPPAACDPSWPLALGRQERERRHATRPMEGDAPFERCASPRMSARGSSSGIADGDWDVLFNAVRDRLTDVVSDNGPDPTASGAARVRDRVLECVEALGLLQNAAADQRLRREGLESAVFEAQTSLAQVRAALVGTRQGERRAARRERGIVAAPRA